VILGVCRARTRGRNGGPWADPLQRWLLIRAAELSAPGGIEAGLIEADGTLATNAARAFSRVSCRNGRRLGWNRSGFLPSRIRLGLQRCVEHDFRAITGRNDMATGSLRRQKGWGKIAGEAALAGRRTWVVLVGGNVEPSIQPSGRRAGCGAWRKRDDRFSAAGDANLNRFSSAQFPTKESRRDLHATLL